MKSVTRPHTEQLKSMTRPQASHTSPVKMSPASKPLSGFQMTTQLSSSYCQPDWQLPSGLSSQVWSLHITNVIPSFRILNKNSWRYPTSWILPTQCVLSPPDPVDLGCNYRSIHHSGDMKRFPAIF